MTRHRTFFFCWTLALGLQVAGGCSSSPSGPKCYPVAGTVRYNGKPIHRAIVTFHPVPVDPKALRQVRPQAGVQEDGSYRLNSYGLNDGAEPGEYAVTVIWTSEAGGADYFSDRFRNPTNPVLKFTVVAGENNVPAIELKGPPIKNGKAVIDGSLD